MAKSKRKKREPPKEEMAPLWMCTYGDLMSLLLCFFVMLFALSTITPPRVEALTEALRQDIVGYAGISTSKSPKAKSTVVVSDSAARSRSIAALLGGQPAPGPAGDSGRVQTMLIDGEVVRGGFIRFEPENDELTEQAKVELKMILSILRGSPYKIIVRGYAAPTEGSGIYDDPELAYSRVVSVVDELVSLGLRRDFFEIEAMGSSATPDRSNLPPGINPGLIGASAEILLSTQTKRALKEDQGQRATDAPIP
jgi:chemotaxis protein MotB